MKITCLILLSVASVLAQSDINQPTNHALTALSDVPVSIYQRASTSTTDPECDDSTTPVAPPQADDADCDDSPPQATDAECDDEPEDECIEDTATTTTSALATSTPIVVAPAAAIINPYSGSPTYGSVPQSGIASAATLMFTTSVHAMITGTLFYVLSL